MDELLSTGAGKKRTLSITSKNYDTLSSSSSNKFKYSKINRSARKNPLTGTSSNYEYDNLKDHGASTGKDLYNFLQ